jgi:hypothetical protein
VASDRGDASEAEEDATNRIRDLLPELRQHDAWAGWLGDKDGEVVAGCDISPAPWDEDFDRPGTRTVTIPSEYRLVVFLITTDSKYYGEPHIWRQTAEERWGSGDSYSEVTTGLYVTDEEANDSEFFKTVLIKTIGLEY